MYGGILIIAGVMTLRIFGDCPNRLSLVVLSSCLIISGILGSILLPSDVLCASVMIIPYVVSTIVAILYFTSGDTYYAKKALLGILITAIFVIVVVDRLIIIVLALATLGVIHGIRIMEWKISIGVGFIIGMFALLSVLLYTLWIVFINTAELLLLCGSLVGFHILSERAGAYQTHTGSSEIRRKLTHLVGLIVLIPLALSETLIGMLVEVFHVANMFPSIMVTNSNIVRYAVIILGASVLPIFLLVEYLRVRRGIALIHRSLLRPHEEHTVAAYVYTLTGVYLVAVLFAQEILIASVLISLISDAAAALVGIYIGRLRITKNRTLEGTITEFVVASIMTYFFTRNIVSSFAVGIALATFDILNIIEINDNLIFQILTATILFLTWTP